MNSGRLHRAIWWHIVKVMLLVAVTLPLVVALKFVAPEWVFVVAFFAYALLVVFPAIFAVGPIGRRIGRGLNDTAVAEAKKGS